MRFFKHVVFLGIISLLAVTNAFAQQPGFSNFWLTPQLTAPTAMAGNDAYQVSAHYRRQGFEESAGYRTFLLSGQFPLYSRTNTPFGTVGVNVMQEESGSSFLFSSSGIMLSYMYDVAISRQHHLLGGVQGGYYGRRVDWSKVTTNNQYVDGHFDPAFDSGEQFSDDPSHAFLVNVGLGYYLADEQGEPLFHVGAALANANNGSFNYVLTNENQSVPKAFLAYAHLRLLSNPSYQIVTDMYLRNERNVRDFVGGFQLRKGTKPRAKVSDNHLGIGLYYSQDQTGTLALQMIQPNWLLSIGYDLVFGDEPWQNMQNAVEVSLGWRAIRSGKDRRTNPGNYRKKLPWKKKRKLPWQSR